MLLISCGCKTQYATKRCSCMSQGLSCANDCSSIWTQLKSYLRGSNGEQPEVIPCACLTRSDVTGSHVTFPPYFFPVLFFPYFFSRTFFPRTFFYSYSFFFVLFSRTFSNYFFPVLFFASLFSPYFFLPYSFFLYFFRVRFSPYFFFILFSRTVSNVSTFEIQRFKIYSYFSSTCRYNTVHVPCGISIQTSPIGLPLDRWGARMRDLKGPKMNLFKAKED